MEMHSVPLRGIKVDPLAHELGTSEGTRPYLNCVIKAYGNNAVGLEAALQAVRDLPLERQYTARVFSARKLRSPGCPTSGPNIRSKQIGLRPCLAIDSSKKMRSALVHDSGCLANLLNRLQKFQQVGVDLICMRRGEAVR